MTHHLSPQIHHHHHRRFPHSMKRLNARESVNSMVMPLSLAPQFASLKEHINLYYNVTNNNYKGKLVLYKIWSYVINALPRMFGKWQMPTKPYLLDIDLKLFVILHCDRMENVRNWQKLYQQLMHLNRPNNNNIKQIDGKCSVNKLIFRSVCVYLTCCWVSFIPIMLAFTFKLIVFIGFIQFIVECIRFTWIKLHLVPMIVTIFQSIYLWKSVQWSRTKFLLSTNDSKCNCFKITHQSNQRFDEIASNYLHKKKQMIKQRYHSKGEQLFHTLFDPISMKSMSKNRPFLQHFFDKSAIKCNNSVVIVRMVQIVMTNDKNATVITPSTSTASASIAPSIQSTNLLENSKSNSIINGETAVNISSAIATSSNHATSTVTSTVITNRYSTINMNTNANRNADESSSTMTKAPIQMASMVKVSTANASNKKSNVIMVKRSKLKDTANGMVQVSTGYRSVSVAAPKSTENRSPQTATSVIIMNKLGQPKNGTNLTKTTDLYETPARTNHLLRILNSPPKPINTSPLPSFGGNLERTIATAQMSDLQKTLKIATTVASEVSIPVTKNENTITMDHTKLRHLLNDQNGNKKLNNNLFICKTEGKVIRLTPLMGSNCFNNVTTTTTTTSTTIQPTISISNEVKVGHEMQQKTVCPIILEKKDSILSKSPPPLTLAMSSANATNAKTIVTPNRSVFEEIYTKFMNTKDIQKDTATNVTDNEKKNGVSTMMDVNESKLIKSNFYSIPSTATILPSKQSTFLQCQGGLLKTETFNATAVPSTFTTGDTKTITKLNTTIQSSPTIYLKQIAKNRQPQSKAGLCEIVVTNENELKVVQKTTNDSSNLNATATITNPALNQIHIFPLIASNGRNVSISSTSNRVASCVRPQVIITGTNAADGHQKIEPEKRNLVDQLREFDMVMEQIKEERNVNEPPDKLMLNNLSGILNHHIIDGCQMRSVSLPQKINLAIIKKTATTTKTVTTTKPTNLIDAKRSTSAPVVVVTSANVTTPKTARLTVESNRELLESIRDRANAKAIAETPVIQSTFENVTSMKINAANIKAVTQTTNSNSNLTPNTSQNAAVKHPQKSQEDEQTVQRIYDILAQYAEQISSSPDLNNKPAPRRRSNLVSIQSSPITSTSIRMVSSKSSMSSSTSSTTVGSIIGSSSNSNSSSESYQGCSVNESRKRSLSLQNDEVNGSDCTNAIDTITIHQPADKKRRISNINLDTNDFILTTMPSLSTYASLPKSSSNDMLKTNNQILITTTATQNAEVMPATIKQDGELLLANGATPMTTKLKPLTIGIANSTSMESSVKPTTQSPATILLPAVVVSTEQSFQHAQAKITTISSSSSSTESARFCGFTTSFPYKINIAGANKCRPFKQCIAGQNFRNDNYILPMGILKYGKGQTVINEQPKINQIVHPNVATVVIPSSTVQRDLGASVKIVSDNKEMPKTQHIQFNIAKKSDGYASIPASTLSSQTTPTLLLRTLSGTNIGGIHSLGKKIDDGFDTICEQLKSSADNANHLLNAFTPLKAHQSDATPIVESIQLPSQIFQSDRGILILGGNNKYATLLTTNYTIPTTTAPIMTETKSCRNDIKSSNAINEPKITAITTPSTSTIRSSFSKIDLKVPICDNDDDFLIENGLNVDSPNCDGDDDTDETFDDLQQSDRIFSLKTLPTLFDGEFSKSTDDILVQSDHSQSDVIDDTQELIYHQHDNVVIIDKQKSDSLTLNSVSSETRMNARTTSIIERELRLQKSLSEECEDLGVDEPSTSELFPDAFISF